MQRFLIFDSQCSRCRDLAATVQDAAGDKLRTLSITDATAQSLLDRAYPTGWTHAPYLIEVEADQVRAWTGLRAALRLGWLLGPRKGMQVWRIAYRSGVRMPLAMSQHPEDVSRRTVLKVGATVAAALAVFGLRPPTASACVPCESCAKRCYFTGSCVYRGTCTNSTGGYLSPYACSIYDCYDDMTGEYCNSYAGNCGCYACV